MSTNRYFNTRDRTSEQNLVEDLITEAIQIYGEDFIYIPRDEVKRDLLYGEDVLETFKDFFEIEMYIQSMDGFEGDGHLFRKFGIDIKDRMTVVVSRARFTESVEGDLDPPRPRGGDLLYLPENGALFEIRFVTDRSVFYQLGEWYVYEMTCEQYTWTHQELETGIEQIDSIGERADYSTFLNFESGALAFEEGEILYQGTYPSNVDPSATVVYAHDDTKVEIKDLLREFRVGENVIGLNSGTTLLLSEYDDQVFVDDGSAVNKEFEDLGDDIIDFSEDNPFSESDY